MSEQQPCARCDESFSPEAPPMPLRMPNGRQLHDPWVCATFLKAQQAFLLGRIAAGESDLAQMQRRVQEMEAPVTIPGTDKQVSREKLVELGLLSAQVAELETQWVHAGAKDSYEAVAIVLRRRAELLRELGVLR